MNQSFADIARAGTYQAVAHSLARRSLAHGAYLADNRQGIVAQKKQADGLAASSPIQRKANNAGLPDQLKAGIENLSGHSMDDVKVHYNSNKPAQLNAHAYAQGTDIHIAAGQEKHLPHEAWHVVQQKQGRVRPTLQMKGKVNINDDKGLEKEADVMGGKAGLKIPPFDQDLLISTQINDNMQPIQGFFGIGELTELASSLGIGSVLIGAGISAAAILGVYKIMEYCKKYDASPQASATAVKQYLTGSYKITPVSALEMIKPLPTGSSMAVSGRSADSGVKIADIASYAIIRFLEKVGDQLTGDHQPSGAAVKEALREALHQNLLQPLTRQAAQNAYKKAITIVMTDAWHKSTSRTYGGRNNSSQINKDASNLEEAAKADWQLTVPELKKSGFSDVEIDLIWQAFDDARVAFFQTGLPQAKLQ